ncbi:hypothetical protein [Acetilactobacillus jinshanensis]|uniref:Uncharacterized protein n=1 Tax=Acetilactobacillus jinshanensis TaxID=1720083 RepID=A0A4P6ZP07_9LACO|nr:hypothetical protein [Acetilactobacillus jinshanensis]QBP18890.1 hypothetical protein ELX58_07290 [Acetilactobacillus jinshanensis]URL60561.1 hypothetical protein HGK75_00505 [uncultured bacterium]
MTKIQDLTKDQLKKIIDGLKDHGIGINTYGIHDDFLYLHRDLESHGQVFMIDSIHIYNCGSDYLAYYSSHDVVGNDWRDIKMKDAGSTILGAALHLFQRVNNYRINELYGME